MEAQMKKTEMMPTPCNSNDELKRQTVPSSLDNLYDDQWPDHCSALSSASFLTQKANKNQPAFVFYLLCFIFFEKFDQQDSTLACEEE